MPKEVALRSSAAEYLTFVASTGEQGESVEMRYEEENIWLTQKKMAQLGIHNMSAYLRKMAIDGLVVNLDMPAFREMLKLMNRTAANVNQIAIHCNSVGGISGKELQELKDAYREQAAQIKKMVSEVITLKSIPRA